MPSVLEDQVAACVGLIILGFGGHARSVADVALATGITKLCFVDDNAQEGEMFLGFPVIPRYPDECEEGWYAFPAAGDNRLRQEQIVKIQNMGWPMAILISPTSTIGVGSTINRGSFIGHHSHVGPMALIGTGCIVNSGAIIEHECTIGSCSHISVNATIAGRCKVGGAVMIGAGATVLDGLEISDGVTVGAGAVVIETIIEAGTYAGVPSKKISP